MINHAEKQFLGSLLPKILMLVLLPLMALSSLGAQNRIDISLKDEPIRKAIAEIERKTDYSFVYSPSIVELGKNITVSLKNRTLTQVLDTLFTKNGISYNIKGKQIILSRHADLGSQAVPQGTSPIRLTGTVSDEKETPMPFVNVFSKQNPKNGTVTDEAGHFAIVVNSEQDEICFSFIGYNTAIENIGKRRIIDIAMTPDSKTLDEIVVVAFGEQNKSAMSSSVSTVKSDEIMQSPVANISNTLAGRVTGLTTMQKSGKPGGDESTMYIRGAGTWNASEPLYVIDGIERNQSQFLRIDPSEVESFSVLKDAAATALYGSKAANGVIILTTKRGKEGELTVHFNTAVTLNQPTRTPHYLGSYESLLLYNEARVNDGYDPLYSAADLMHYKMQDDPYRYPNTDWYKLMMKEVTPQYNTSFNVRGGSKTVKYFVSATYMNQAGQMKTSQGRVYNPKFSYQRYTFRSNLDIMPSPYFTISLDLGGGITDRSQPVDEDELFAYMNRVPPWIMPALNPDGSWAGTRDFPNQNPYYRLNSKGCLRTKNNTVTSAVKLEYDFRKIVKGLSASVRMAYDSNFGNNKQWTETQPTYELISAPGKTEKYIQLLQRSFFSSSSSSISSTRKVYGEANVTYKHNFDRHSVSVMGIANISEYRSSTNVPYNSVSFICRMNYAYMQRYYLELNGAYRGSENFAPGKRFGFFPSTSAGWNVHNEDFMKKVKFVNKLKVRASYGITGNDYANVRFIYKEGKWITGTTSYAKFGYDAGSSLGYTTEPLIANPDATWETAYQTNLGFDLAFWHKRFNLSVDRFFEKRIGILMAPNSTPGILGIKVSDMNIGKTQKDGWEVELGYNQKISNRFAFNLRGTFSFVKNKVIFKDEPEGTLPWQKQEGLAIGQRFGYLVEGFFQSWEEIENAPIHKVGSNPIPGDLRYKDINGDATVDTYDRVPIGWPTIPRITYGFTLGFDYRNLSFSAHFQGSSQSSVFISQYLMYEFYNGGKVQDIHLDRWTPQTAATATYPALHIGGASQNHVQNSFFMKDNPYLRLKTVELAYILETKGMQRSGIKAIRVSASGVNLLTFDKLKVVDPETPSGSRGAIYPQTRGFSLGFNITF